MSELIQAFTEAKNKAVVTLASPEDAREFYEFLKLHINYRNNTNQISVSGSTVTSTWRKQEELTYLKDVWEKRQGNAREAKHPAQIGPDREELYGILPGRERVIAYLKKNGKDTEGKSDGELARAYVMTRRIVYKGFILGGGAVPGDFTFRESYMPVPDKCPGRFKTGGKCPATISNGQMTVSEPWNAFNFPNQPNLRVIMCHRCGYQRTGEVSPADAAKYPA